MHTRNRAIANMLSTTMTAAGYIDDYDENLAYLDTEEEVRLFHEQALISFHFIKTYGDELDIDINEFQRIYETELEIRKS